MDEDVVVLYLAAILLLSVVIMLLSPQPRPMTPTFLQNCLLVGLQAGCTWGFRCEHDRVHGPGADGAAAAAVEVATPSPDAFTARTIFLRTVTGYTAVLAVRQIAKTLLTALVRCFGVDPSPVGKLKLKIDQPTKDKEEADEDDEDEDDPWGQHVPLDKYVPRVLDGWDLWGAALVKFVSYTLIAWLITCGCPWAFELCGLSGRLPLKAGDVAAQQ